MRKVMKLSIQFYFMIILIMIANIQPLEAKIITDSTGDIVHILDNSYVSVGNDHPEIDITSLEITSEDIYLTLSSAPNTIQYRRYEVEIYWSEIVEERGFNFYKNKTKCIFDYEDEKSETWVYNSEGTQIVHSTVSYASRDGNVIHWPISIEMGEPNSHEYFFDPNNPKTVFVKTTYSETLEIAYPTGTIEEWFDFYPDESQAYYEVAPLKGIYLGLLGILVIMPFIRKYKKK